MCIMIKRFLNCEIYFHVKIKPLFRKKYTIDFFSSTHDKYIHQKWIVYILLMQSIYPANKIIEKKLVIGRIKCGSKVHRAKKTLCCSFFYSFEWTNAPFGRHEKVTLKLKTYVFGKNIVCSKLNYDFVKYLEEIFYYLIFTNITLIKAISKYCCELYEKFSVICFQGQSLVLGAIRWLTWNERISWNVITV